MNYKFSISECQVCLPQFLKEKTKTKTNVETVT